MKRIFTLLICLFVTSSIYASPNHKSDNTGFIGINLRNIKDWSTAYPFLNFVKQAREFNDGKGGKLDLDENGWVRSLKSGQFVNILFVTLTQDTLPYKRFIVRYKGEGKVIYWHAAKKIKSIAKNVDLIEVDISNRDVAFGVMRITRTNPRNYIRDIEIVPQKYIDIYDKGEIFNPDYINFISQFKTLRFMDWLETNNSHIARWDERPKMTDSRWSKKGVPYEVIIRLANKTKTNPWITIPHLATDTHIRKLAKLIKKSLDPGLIAYIEYSNEVWNRGFLQARYATDMGIKRWGRKTPFVGSQWYAMRSAQICDIFKKEIFKNESSRIHCVIGTQTAWKNLGNYVLDCPQWVKEGNEPCYKHGFNSLAITGYFKGCLDGAPRNGKPEYTDRIRDWARQGKDGIKKAFDQIEFGTYFDCNLTLNELGKLYRYYKQVADKRGLILTAYEGGSHVVVNGYAKYRHDELLVNFSHKLNRHKRMYDLYIKNFNLWKNYGGDIFLHYYDIGLPSKHGSWGAIEYLGQKSTPKYDAILTINRTQK